MSIGIKRPISVERIFIYGATGGIIGGIILMLVEIVGAMLAETSPLMPVQTIAALVLGPKIAGLERIGMFPLIHPTTTTLAIGLGIHLILSIVYGTILVLIVLAVPALRSSVRMMTVVGIGFGILIWLINFHVVDTAASPWFLSTSVIQQLVAHGLFGGALGYFLGAHLVTQVR